MKTKMLALPVAFAIVFTPLVASAQVCGIGIIAAAMVASAQENRELTQKEAMSCGLMYGQDRQNVKKTTHKRHHARHKKPKKENS